MDQFEEKLHQDLHQFLLSMKEVDERLPECPSYYNTIVGGVPAKVIKKIEV